MTNDTSAVAGTVFGDVRRATPAILAVVAIVVADATLDGWLVLAALVATVVAFFGALAYLDRSEQGAESRHAREAHAASLDATETRAREAASWAPFVIAIVIGTVAGGDSYAMTFVLSLVAGFVLSQGAFVLWLRSRRSP